MRLVSTKQFHDKATQLLRSKEPLVVTNRGAITGYYIPQRGKRLPPDVRWRMIDEATSRVRKELERQGVTEEEISQDFENWRKSYRSSRHRP